jgi:Fe-Mn family superoxide dismutase
MTQLPRRDFLATAALAGVAVVAATQNANAARDTPAEPLVADLIPGAIDAAGEYVLPALPYAYEALADVIDPETMTLHHSKHHQSYVNGLKDAESKLAAARQSGDFALVEHWSAKAAFHGAGHFLHCVFWDSMAATGTGGEPAGELLAQLEKDFGGVKPFLAHFAAASKSVEGSGWAILGWSIAARKLVLLQSRNHQLQTQWGIVPLLCNDVWEHAYYLKYQNRRADYVDAFPKIISWNRVGARFALLSSQKPS